MARRGSGVSNWTVVLGAALLLAVAAIVWVLANRTAERTEDADLTVPPVELPDAPIPPGPTPTPDPPTVPIPGPT